MPTIDKYQKLREKEKIAYNYYISQGYSPEASAGIVGNLVYESGLNTSAEGDIGFKGGSSFGIAQFRGQRLKNLKSMYGSNWTNFNNQLEFVKHELETTHKKANNVLRNTRNAHEAGQAFSDYYEMPQKKYKQNSDRRNKVGEIYSRFSGAPYEPSEDIVETSTSNKVNGESSTVQENLFNYAVKYPTTTFKDLETSSSSDTFVQSKEEDKELERVKKETQEYNFLQEFNKLYQAPTQQQVEATVYQQQEVPTQNLQDIYSQVSQFVDTPIAQQGGKIGNLTDTQQQDIEKQREWLNNWNTNREIKGEKINSNTTIPFSKDIYVDDLNYYGDGKSKTLGEFDPITNRLIFDTDYTSRKGIPTHEFTHRFEKDYKNNNAGGYKNYISDPINKYLNSQELNSYNADPDETHAEINRLRYNEGYKPDQTISREDIDKADLSGYNFNQFNKDEVLDILNSTANSSKVVTDRIVQQGGRISEFTTKPIEIETEIEKRVKDGTNLNIKYNSKIQPFKKTPKNSNLNIENISKDFSTRSKQIYLDEDSKQYKRYKEADKYYNPEKIKDISTGDWKQDALYDNEWLLDVPIVGDMLKNRAKDIAINSGGAPSIDLDEKVSEKDKEIGYGYGSTKYSGSEENNRIKQKATLIDQYFSKEPLLDRSNYKPTSDYMEFLPTYSLKGNFEEDIKKNKDTQELFKEQIQNILKQDKLSRPKDFKKESKNNEWLNEFLNTKKSLYQNNNQDSPLSEMLGVNLAGHKTGIAFDEEKNLPYISISDAWDFSPKDYSEKWKVDKYNDEDNKIEGDKGKAFIQSYLMHKAGNPFKVYDRFYFDPKTKEYLSDERVNRNKQQGGIIKDQQGQRNHPNRVTQIEGNKMATDGYGDITLYTVPDVGNPKIIKANSGEHTFPGANNFTEYPITKNEEKFLKYISKIR